MDKIFHENVLDGCALHHDIKIWSPYEDLTTVEERGINLSGGQKQHIQLARVVYYESYIFISLTILSVLLSTLFENPWPSMQF